MNEQDKYIELSMRFFEGNCSAEEAELLMSWLEEKEENRKHYFLLKSIWIESVDSNASNQNKSTEIAWSRLDQRMLNSSEQKVMKLSKPNRINWKLWVTAASLALVIITSILILLDSDFEIQHISQQAEVYAPHGSRTYLVLSDGTEVWLNSGSRIIYPENFRNRTRNVELIGEAYFVVEKSYGKDFIVTTSDVAISVLGTKFNIKAYPDEGVVETTLVEGQIEANGVADNSLERLLLSPSEKLVYLKQTNHVDLNGGSFRYEDYSGTNIADRKVVSKNAFVVKLDNTDIVTSWKDEKLIIKSERMDYLARKLERYYDVKILLTEESLKEIRFSGVLDNITIDEVMQAISSTSRIKYSTNGKEIKLSIKK